MRKINQIVIHCSATKARMDIGAKEIRSWHKGRGFVDIGYHYVIRRDGTREIGRELERAGAHAEGHNANSIGICMAGGIDVNGKAENNFTGPQFGELERLVRELLAKHPNAEVLGHRDIPGVAKDCPCFDVKEWFRLEFGS